MHSQKIAGLMIARNEDWVIGLSLRAALKWVDSMVVLCHSCTDQTREIAIEVQAEHPGRVLILESSDAVWYEMRHRMSTLDAARSICASHMAIIDADEVLTGDMLSTIRALIFGLPPSTTLQLPMRNLHRSINTYRSDDTIWGTQATTTIAFADHPSLRWEAKKGYDHHQREPRGSRRGNRLTHCSGGVMHLQFADWRRLRAKHALYKMIERIRWPEKSVHAIDHLYNLALDEHICETAETPWSWWEPYWEMSHLVKVGSMPWQEIERDRLIAERGLEFFAGLDLFIDSPLEECTMNRANEQLRDTDCSNLLAGSLRFPR